MVTARAKQKFTGELTDGELYLLEDGLEALKKLGHKTKLDIDKVIMRLYKFWES